MRWQLLSSSPVPIQVTSLEMCFIQTAKWPVARESQVDIEKSNYVGRISKQTYMWCHETKLFSVGLEEETSVNKNCRLIGSLEVSKFRTTGEISFRL